MGSTITKDLGFIIIFLLFSIVHGVNVQDLDDLIREHAARANTRRHKTGTLYDISLPRNISSDIKASVVTLRNSVFWRKGANYSGIYIPPMVKTTTYAKRIAFVYERFGESASSVYFRLGDDDYSFVSNVIGFTVHDATNTNDLIRLNLSVVRDKPILINFGPYKSENRGRIKCIAFGDNGVLEFSNVTRYDQCSTTKGHGHYALVVIKPKTEPESVKGKWWFVLGVIGVFVLVLGLIIVVVKLVRKKKLRKMERESEKSEMIGNVWIGRSRMPAATMVRTQPNLEYHEDLPTSSNIP